MKTMHKLFVWILMGIFMCMGCMVALNYYVHIPETVPYSKLLTDVGGGKITEVTVGNDSRTMVYKMDGQSYKTVVLGDPTATLSLISKDNKLQTLKVEPPSSGSSGGGILLTIIISCIPVLLLIGVMVWIFKKQSGGGDSTSGINAFGKSKARKANPAEIQVDFNSVAMSDEDRLEIQELIDFLKNPEDYKKVNAKIPSGILLTGPPGTGKTLVAKAIAKEADVAFFSASGAEFEEMLVGAGASRVRSMFEDAKKEGRAIIFIDEIDALAGNRSNSMNNSGTQTLNQLLTQMDGFEGDEELIVIGATNRVDTLDPAILRPGRFDRIVSLDLPDIKTRFDILKIHLAKIVQYENDENINKIAKGTPGFSGAELAKLVNEAAIFAAREKRSSVDFNDLEKAKDKVMMGCESPRKMNKKEIENTGYHESGHAIVGWLSPEHDTVYKVSIIPRERALGVTMFLPEDEKYSLSKQAILGQIQTLLAGRAAEEMILGENGVTTGASNDIERATSLARLMIKSWGLSKIGLAHYGQQGNGSNSYSDETSKAIDDAVEETLKECYTNAMKILKDNEARLHSMTALLIEKETIDEDDIKQIMEEG